jgi:hypothetical protein
MSTGTAQESPPFSAAIERPAKTALITGCSCCPQFAAARPDVAVSDAIERLGGGCRNSCKPSTDRSRTAVHEAKIAADKDIPHVTTELIVKYITDLQLLGLL